MTVPMTYAARIAEAVGPNTQMESSYQSAMIETVRITNVNVDDWTVDAIALFGNKRFEDVQVSCPYFHHENGEGIYIMPEAGALAWVCKPSDGEASRPFILGFQAPFDTENNSFRCGRQTLNPGDIMLRTRDENFIILRRGGVVQIGAAPLAQRIYIPIKNFIKDFCENYQLQTLGGKLAWIVDRTDQTTEGNAPSKVSLLVKELANNPRHIAELTIGSHGEDDSTTLMLKIKESGDEGAEQKVLLTITKEGDVSWRMENSYTVSVKSDILFETDDGDFEVNSGKDIKMEADGNFEVKASTKASIEATSVKVKAPSVLIEGQTALGASGGQPPAVAPQVVAALTAIAGVLDGLSGGAATTALTPILPQIPAKKVTVK